jgi:cell division protein FtsL
MTVQVIRRGIANPVSFSNLRTCILLLGLLALFGLIYVGQSTQATLGGQRVQDLQERLDRLNRENAQMQYEIAVLTTPAKIADRARALGLRPAAPAQMVFLTVKNYPGTLAKAAPSAAGKTLAPLSADAPVAVGWNELIARLGLSPSPRMVEATTNP